MNTLLLLNVSIVFYISFILILWFLSDIVDTFSKITKTKKFFKIEDYKSYRENKDAAITYPDFLFEINPCWYTQLLSCPICLCFWSTLITTILFLNITSAIFLFPVNYVCSLFLYLLIKKLL